LGLTITEYERMDYEKLLSGDDEFYIEPRSIDKTLAVMEKQIAGSILLTGRFGEWLWPRERCRNWGIRGETGHPLLQVPGRHKLGGCALGEFRLRTGFIDFPLLCSGALHAAAIQAITESGAMNQWSVPGGYNRPIARRIAEEAGVPRHLFGQSKKGGPRVRGGERRSGVRLLIYSLWEAAYWPPLRILILRLTGNRLNPAWRKGSFTVQRGAERIMQRYLAAVSAAEACAPAMPAR